MSVRRAIIAADPAELNVTEFCREHKVSPWSFYNIKRRHAEEGDAALEPKSRAPKRVANKTPAEIEDEIVAARKRLDDSGWDCGPASIAWELRDLKGLPSEATIWRILTARGCITPNPAKAPKRSWRRFSRERANECWQIDDTSWELADGTEVKIFNALDDCSRHCVASTAMTTCTGARALVALAEAAGVLGWPEWFLSDNAPAFCEMVAAALAELGIAARHSRPYHPQTNGKVERFHQTQKRWLAKQPRPATLEELQAQLDCFRHHYNHERPHRALNRRTPAEVWTETPKSGPADKPITAPTQVTISTVHGGAAMVGTRLRISIGAAYNGRQALIVITGLACHVFVDGRLARHLKIDPDRRDQPLYKTPGRPPATVRKAPRHP